MISNGQAPGHIGIEMHLNWIPQTGQFQVAFPQVDDVTILGMLEMAKTALEQKRRERDNRIAMPTIAFPGGAKV